jgi:potassium-transporting ATPase KdpC subunit
MKNIIIAVKLFILLTIITGVAYPLTITVFAQLAYPEKAKGSMISINRSIIGSELIGQQFTKPEYFWGRPSAIANNPMPSGASNLNPVGETLKTQIQARIDTIRKYQGNVNIIDIPKDLLFASGSGVDPDISPEAIYFQFNRVSNYRRFTEEQKNKLKIIIESSIKSPDFYIFGEPRVNVLKLNLKLNEL